MIVITDIKTVDTGDIPYYKRIEPQKSTDLTKINPVKPITETVPIEIITGQRFKNSEGKDITIGMTKKVDEILGFPFKVMEQNNKLVNDYYHKNIDLKRTISLLKKEIEYHKQETEEWKAALEITLNDIKTMSFWKRLKFLFTKRI